jgi:hypothetical protein
VTILQVVPSRCVGEVVGWAWEAGWYSGMRPCTVEGNCLCVGTAIVWGWGWLRKKMCCGVCPIVETRGLLSREKGRVCLHFLYSPCRICRAAPSPRVVVSFVFVASILKNREKTPSFQFASGVCLGLAFCVVRPGLCAWYIYYGVVCLQRFLVRNERILRMFVQVVRGAKVLHRSVV